MRSHALAILLSLFFSALGQGFDITGRILDKHRTPLSGVVVRLAMSGISDTTNIAGVFSIKTAPQVGAIWYKNDKQGRLPLKTLREYHQGKLYSLTGRKLPQLHAGHKPLTIAAGSYLFSEDGATQPVILYSAGTFRTLMRHPQTYGCHVQASQHLARLANVIDTLVIDELGYQRKAIYIQDTDSVLFLGDIVLYEKQIYQPMSTFRFEMRFYAEPFEDSCATTGEAVQIASNAYRGGLSPDGTYLGSSELRGSILNIKTGKAFAVNPGLNVGRPQMSFDTVNFRGCLLWLNRDDTVNVNADRAVDSTIQAWPGLSNKIFITDTTNKVRWFWVSTLKGQEITSLRWASHPDYLILGRAAYSYAHDGIVLSLSDTSELVFNSGRCGAQPDLWVNPEQRTQSRGNSTGMYDTATGFLGKSDVIQFFGTAMVKIAHIVKGQGSVVQFVDYSTDGIPVNLPMPENREPPWGAAWPRVSPDGMWVAYHVARGWEYSEVYVQALVPGARAHLVSEDAGYPQWWVDQSTGATYVVFTSGPNKAVFEPY